MPNKEPKYTQGKDNEYIQEYKAYIKSEDPFLTDSEADAFSKAALRENVSKLPKQAVQVAQPKVDNSLIELAKKVKSAKTTGQAFGNFVSERPKPVMQDPMQAASKVGGNDELEQLIASGKELTPETPIEPTTTIVPQIDNTRQQTDNLYTEKVASTFQKDAETINQIRENIYDRNKDGFIAQAEKAIPQGTKQQQQAYANTLRSNTNAQADYNAETAANMLPDEEFEKAINRKDLLTANRGTLISQKFGGDANAINESLREYMDSPQLKIDALKYAQGKGDLKKGVEIALDEKANALAGLPSKVQQTATKIANQVESLPYVGKPLMASGRLIEGALRAPMEIGSGIYSGLQTIDQAARELNENKKPNLLELFAENNKRNMQQVNLAVPSLRPDDKSNNKVSQFVGDLANTLGYLEGGMLSTAKLPALADKARKAAAFGTLDETVMAAQQAGKTRTVADKMLNSLQEQFKGSNSIKVAELLDNATKNTVMMSPSLMDANYQKYLDAGFTKEQATNKAGDLTLINTIGLSVPGVLRHSKPSLRKEVMGVGETSKLKGALKQGAAFGIDMQVLDYAQKKYDENNGIVEDVDVSETFKNRAKDVILGAVMHLTSGQSGKKVVRQRQRDAIGQTLADRSLLNSELEVGVKNGTISQEQAAQTNAFLNTLEPLYAEAKEGGFNEEQAVSYAIAQTKASQWARKAQAIDEQIKSTARLVKETDENGNSVEVTKYLQDDGRWSDTPDKKLQKELKTAQQEINNAARSYTNLKKYGTTLEDDMYIGSAEAVEIAKQSSPEGVLKPRQDIAIEFNAPYRSEEVSLKELADQPKVKEAIEELQGQDLQGLELNTPIVGENGEVLDGNKVVAAAILRGEETMPMLKSIPLEEVAKEANAAAQESFSGEMNAKGLDKVATKALEEMSGLYEEHLNEFEGDFFGATQKVISDAVERGYTKEEAMNMVERVNDGKPISDVVVEKIYNNEVAKSQPENVKSVQEPVEIVSRETESSVGVGGDVGLGDNPIVINISLPFNEGVNTGLVKNSKGAVYHDRNSAKLEKLGYSKEQIDNLSQTELNEILAKNIENPNVATSAKLPIAEEQTTTQEFLNEASKEGGRFAELANKLKDFFGLGDTKTTIVKGLTDFFGGKAAGDYGNNQIRIDEKSKNKLQVFLHEAIHKVTVEKLLQFERGDYSKLSKQDIDALQNLTRIFDESKIKIHEFLGGGKNDRTKGHYGFTNVHEFISEAFTNPEFQHLLKNLPTEGKSPTIFKQFLDAVAKFLGLKDASILNDIFHHTENLKEQSLKETTKKETDGTTELERTTRTSEGKSEQGEGGTSIAEQSDVRAVEANKEGQEAEALKDVESTAKALSQIDTKKIKLAEKFTEKLTDKDAFKMYNFLSKRRFAKELGFASVPTEGSERVKYLKYRLEYLDKVQDKIDRDRGDGVTEEWLNFYEKAENEFLDIQNELISESEIYIDEKTLGTPYSISEAYHKAKEDGSNPKLVKAVEDFIGKPSEKQSVRAKEADVERQEYTTKNGKYKIAVDKGQLKVLDNEGKEINPSTAKQYLSEYKDNKVYDNEKDVNELTENVTDETSYYDAIAESENPAQVASELETVPKYIPENELDFIESGIAQLISTVSREHYGRFGDPNNIAMSKAKAYLRNEGREIDTLAQEVESMLYGDWDAANPRVTEQDIIDFIDKYPNGAQEFYKQKNPTFTKLYDRLEKLLGYPPSSKDISNAAKQYNKRLQGNEVLQESRSAESDFAKYLAEENRYEVPESELEKQVELEKAAPTEIIEAKKAFDELLETHKEKLKVQSETKKKVVAEKEAEIVAEKPNIKILSENFKTTLKMLQDKGIIEVRDMEDC